MSAPDAIEAAYAAEQQALADRLVAENGYLAARVLADGSVAVLERLLTTYSIALGVDAHTWRYRFCYRDQAAARAAFDALRSEDDVPDGWIACRPEVRVMGDDNAPRYPTPTELRDMRAKRRTTP